MRRNMTRPRLTRSFIHSLSHLLINPLIHLFIHSLIHVLIHSLSHSSIHSLCHSLIHLFIHPFSIMLEMCALKSGTSGFKSQRHHVRAPWTPARYLGSLGFGFLILYKGASASWKCSEEHNAKPSNMTVPPRGWHPMGGPLIRAICHY